MSIELLSLNNDRKHIQGFLTNFRTIPTNININDEIESQFIKGVLAYLVTTGLLTQGETIGFDFAERALDLLNGMQYTDSLKVSIKSGLIEMPFRTGPLQVTRFFTNLEAFNKRAAELSAPVAPVAEDSTLSTQSNNSSLNPPGGPKLG